MSTDRKCPRCGADLPTDELDGLCPSCVIKHLIVPLARELGPQSLAPSGKEEIQPSVAAGQSRRLRYFGDYELLEEVASGGMGIVYRARQLSLNRIVAVKMIRAGLLADDAEVRRFHVEAEAAASLDHPNIVPLYEVGEHGGQQYFSMKLIEGGSLASVAASRQSAAGFREDRNAAFCRDAATLMAKIARAVHYAHQRGILHRDLKPGNILLDAQGEPHITDFGLALRLESETHFTMTGTVLGTPSYMSPEQAAGKVNQLTTASDIYSLGAILYELLAGQPPFKAATALETLRQVVEEEPVPPGKITMADLRLTSSPVKGRVNRKSKIVNRLDPDLETICLKCLEKDPQRRYASAAELADDLERFNRCEPILARRSTVPERVVKWTRRHPVHAAGSAALLLVFLAGVAGIAWEWRRAEQALRVSRDSLWQANFDRANALRTSGHMGQRVAALKAIRAAAAIRPTLELRNEAIAAMALADLEDVGFWRPLPTNAPTWAVDAKLECLATCRLDGVIEVRGLDDGQLRAVLTNWGSAVTLSFSPGGDVLWACDGARVRLWDWRTTNQVLDVSHFTADGAFSRDGRWFAYAESSNGVTWLDLRARSSTRREIPVRSKSLLALSEDGQMLAIQRGPEVQVWRQRDGSHLGTRHIPAAAMTLDWMPGALVLAIGCEDQNIYVWDPVNDRLQTLAGHRREGVLAHWHPDGSLLVSVAWDEILRLWDPCAGSQLLETKFARPNGFSPDGQWLLAKNARGLGRLKVHLPSECRLFHTPVGLEQKVVPVFSPDSRFLLGLAEDGSRLRVWELQSGRCVADQPMHGENGIEFASPRTLVTSGTNGLLLWTNSALADGWNLERQAVIVPAGDGRLGSVAFNPDYTRLTAGHNRTGEVYEFPSGRHCFSLTGQRLFGGAVFSGDGRWLTSGYFDNRGAHGSEFWIWSAADGQPVRKIPNGNGGAVFSPDGQWMVLADEHDYFQYAVNGHPANWTVVRRFPMEVSGFVPGGAAFSTDSKLLVLHADQRTLRLLDPTSGRELARLTPLPDAFRTWRPSLSRDGRWLSAVSDIGLHVWDLQLIRQRLREMRLDWE